MVELIIHVGTGKTGSTSIQRSLKTNSDLLKTQGAYYLGMNFENLTEKFFDWQVQTGWPRLHNLKPDEKRNQLIRCIDCAIEFAKNNNVDKLIWSNEAIFENADFFIPLLEQVVGDDVKITIVTYIRRPDLWAQSAYGQWGIKHKTYSGPLQKYSDWIKNHRPIFSDTLIKWEGNSHFNFKLVNFNNSEDIVASFFVKTGLNPAGINVVKDNESPNDVAMALWALYNNTQEGITFPAEMYGILKRANVIDKKIEHLDHNGLYPSTEESQNLLDEYRDEIEQLNGVFERNDETKFNNNKKIARVKNVTDSQLISALLLIIKSQQGQIDEINTKLSRVMK